MNNLNLKICWMYHDIMDLYGDKGNIMSLSYRCLKRNIKCEIHTCGLQDAVDLSEYDILFLGGGADREQSIILDDLLARKQNILKAMDEQTFIFLICGGYQLFGQYYMTSSSYKMNGLQIFDYYTEAGKSSQRCVGNIAIECNLDGNSYQVVGFENHGGQTYQVKSPFGKVISGYGNSQEKTYEGFYNGNVLGTYLHGPLLPKNPEICDFIIYKGLKKRNPNFQLNDLMKLDDELEHKAKEIIWNRLVNER